LFVMRPSLYREDPKPAEPEPMGLV
jgi:hypothetical protein